MLDRIPDFADIFRYAEYAPAVANVKSFTDREHIAYLMTHFVRKFTEEYDTAFDIITVPPKSTDRGEFYFPTIGGRYLAKWLGVKFQPNILYKVYETPRQKAMPRYERVSNIDHTFAVKPKYYSVVDGKNILVFDDIATTGSTLSDVRRALYKANAEYVKLSAYFTT
jgi:predicted amidophosphoribosyltransferase